MPPKPRLQADINLGVPTLQPAARPNDTYVQPTGAGSQAAQLANALSNIAPKLAQLSGQLFERNTKKDTLAGEEAARETVRKLDESRTSFADAVRNGDIPAHMNPWMKQGYYEELGRTYAGRFNADLTEAIQLDENLKNTVEMEDFRQFAAKFEGEWRENQVPAELRNQAFQVGYGNRRDAILANLEAGWSAQTENRFTKRTLAMFRDESVQYIEDALDKELSVEQIGAFLRQTWDDKHALGWDGRLTGTTLVDAIADVALSRKDPELMEKLLASIPGGDGSSKNATLGRTAYAIEAQERTEGEIFTARRRQWDQDERERAQESKSIYAAAATRFEQAEQDGLDQDDVNINDLQAQAIALGNVELANNIQTLHDAYRNREYEDDNDLVAEYLEKLHRGPFVLTQAELRSSLKAKQLSLQTYSSLSSQLESAQREARARVGGGGPSGLNSDKDFDYAEKTLRGYFGSSPDADTPEVSYRRTQANRQLAAWYQENFLAKDAPNKNVTGYERRQMIDAQAQNLARVWVAYDDDFSGTFRLSGENTEWTTRPVDIPDRLEPQLDELQRLLSGSGGSPSPRLVSLLQIYRIDVTNRAQMQTFLDTQRRFIQ